MHEVPEGWTTRRLLDVVSIANGQVDPTMERYRDWPLVAPNHIESGTGRLLGVETAAEQAAISGKYVVEPGDVVYSKIRPYLKKVWLSDRKGLCSADMYPMRAGTSVDSGYLLALLLSDHFTRYAEAVSARTGIPKINREELAGYRAVFPPLPEQKKIAGILSSVDEAIQATQAVIEQTRRVKEGLLQTLLTRGIGSGGVPHTRFKQTEIGEIPESWEVRELQTLCTANITYGVVKPGPSDPDGVAFVRSGDLRGGTIELAGLRTITQKVSDQYERTKLRGGELLVGLVGQPGATAIVPPELAGGNIARQAAMLRVDESKTATSFVRNYLDGPVGQAAMGLDVVGSVQQVINLKSLRKVPVPVPERGEQREINGIIRSVNDALVVAAQKLEGLEEVKAGLLQDLLTGKVRVSV